MENIGTERKATLLAWTWHCYPYRSSASTVL